MLIAPLPGVVVDAFHNTWSPMEREPGSRDGCMGVPVVWAYAPPYGFLYYQHTLFGQMDFIRFWTDEI